MSIHYSGQKTAMRRIMSGMSFILVFVFSSALGSDQTPYLSDNVARMVTAQNIASSIQRQYGIRGKSVSESLDILAKDSYFCGIDLRLNLVGPLQTEAKVSCTQQGSSYQNCPEIFVSLDVDWVVANAPRAELVDQFTQAKIRSLSAFCPYDVVVSENFLIHQRQAERLLSDSIRSTDFLEKPISEVFRRFVSEGYKCGYVRQREAPSAHQVFSCIERPSRIQFCFEARIDFRAYRRNPGCISSKRIRGL